MHLFAARNKTPVRLYVCVYFISYIKERMKGTGRRQNDHRRSAGYLFGSAASP